MVDLGDNPFDTTDAIFEWKQPLKKDTFSPETIFHRDEEISLYINALQDVVVGHDPNNIFVFGPTGVGKTAVTKWVRDKLQEKAAEEGVPLHVIGPINCRNYRSAYSLVTSLVNEFREPDNKLPESGYSTDNVFEFLHEEIEAVGGNVLIILDEIDNIPPDARNDFLYDLPRAEANENTPIETAKIGLIGISNDLKFVDVLEPKVKSTLGEREIKFGPYNANELRDILGYYADMAFRDGVLQDEVVPLAAAFSAQERGDVRQGLRILEKAGEYARMSDGNVVTEEHVRQATETIETDELLDYFEDDLSSQQALTYLATTLAIIEPGHEATTKRVYNLYSSIAESSNRPVKSERKLYEFLDQLSMQGLVRSAEQNLGIKGGRKFIYDVTDDPRDILNAALKSSYKNAVPSNAKRVLKSHLEDEASEFQPPDTSDPQQRNLWKFT
ncbi:orc1/cdc6 family replication initiation protein [Halorubrum lacusprofundi ATCC 49239]|jgi:orc1/cdc6 family replication initiation protein|uniref:ORC1-type DNA replication protein n=1 Tax=Halorubrum lacusprofundi (strain ATCC 49239 / DSM 5036 / JCM 8891 / ACAM 34) TaxID=416348 RepID=B9LVS8_HALLT|nr:AAA family ATPase [Halorubrum lacusprofundi]ACM58318.1 orc1/cdc6 family replication initiation protein [Halorubrum lacusprofundi ATCC 49239]